MKKIILVLICLLFIGGCLELVKTPAKNDSMILDKEKKDWQYDRHRHSLEALDKRITKVEEVLVNYLDKE